MNKESKNLIINKLKTNKKITTIIIVIASFLLVLSLTFFTNTKKVEEETNFAEEYVKSLENRLTEVLSKIEGAKDVNVIIKAESGLETVLATETIIKENGNIKETIETPITVNGKTVVLKELYPKITGVLIVTEGANNISLNTKLINATTSLLGVDIKNIQIISTK